jgi:hypothetical protein
VDENRNCEDEATQHREDDSRDDLCAESRSEETGELDVTHSHAAGRRQGQTEKEEARAAAGAEPHLPVARVKREVRS